METHKDIWKTSFLFLEGVQWLAVLPDRKQVSVRTCWPAGVTVALLNPEDIQVKGWDEMSDN